MQYGKLFILVTTVAVLSNSCIPSAKVVSVPAKKSSPHSSDNMLLVDVRYRNIIERDDFSKKSLFDAIGQSLLYLERIPPTTKFAYGSDIYTAREVIASMALFKRLLNTYPKRKRFIEKLERYFHLFASSANREKGVLFTGYYEPIFKGSLTRTEEFYVPVYGLPDDLITLNLGKFRESLKERTAIVRIDKGKIVPYYSRKEIMQDRVIASRNLEIAWMRDPVDLFFLQIQGSGMLELPNGVRVKLSYAGANGRRYSSIGKLLLDRKKMELEEISMASIRKYLSDHPKERDDILFHNKSYTFLKLERKTEAPRGNINTPLTPLRSIASDPFVFPKGALGYIQTEVPRFDENGNMTGRQPISRFVLNQDTGGAIRGPGRVDLFWGNGALAEKSAGTMRSYGAIYFLIAKKEILAKLIDNR